MKARKKKSNRTSSKLQLESLEIRRVMDGAAFGDLDWGDAPDNILQQYETLATNNGAHHLIDPTHFLGAGVDGEPDGQPDPNALGDDLNGAPDEDGVQFLTPMVPGNVAQVEVTASFDGHLSAWIDFSGNGKFDHPAEQVFASQFIPGGPNVLNVAVPATATVGQTFSRWRFVESPEPLLPGGPGTQSGQILPGEVEDHELRIDEPQGDGRDWGDAPDFAGSPFAYRTTAANFGANHVIHPTVYLGDQVDPEPDGQPSIGADRDDMAGPSSDDEDGVIFLTPIVAGQLAEVEVTANDDGFLSAWMDFNGNGVWNSPAERIFSVVFLPAGTHNLQFMVPAGAQPGDTYSRWRFTNVQAPLEPWGTGLTSGQDTPGEVEDYLNEIIIEPQDELDWGDAPDGAALPGNYNTLSANNGAFHLIDGMTYLGMEIDAEADGQPDLVAVGDDLAGPALDDEDGIKFLTPLVAGQFADIEVTANVDGFLNTWVDFNGNGMWDAAEQVHSALFVPAGVSVQTFFVPFGSTANQTFARFRFTNFQSPIGPAGSGTPFVGVLPGEVEDYEVFIDREDGQFDWGDAPESPNGPHFYPTTSANNGAFHIIDNVHFLGNEVDAEADGQPNLPASGDDIAGPAVDDEDGVRFLTPIVPGQAARVEVTANADGFLNAWMDFDRNGVWDHPAEQIFSVQFLTAGTHLLSFNVPASADPGGTYSRWRFTDFQGQIVPWGTGATFGAINGEVEDYRNKIIGPGDFDGDGEYTCSDIDALVAEIASGANNPAFDLNGDLLVNTVDRDVWLAEAGSANLFSQNSYLLGDANLDGAVDGNDFVIWNNNKFTNQAAWCKGDFTANGVIDGGDFVLWNANKFMNAGPIMASQPQSTAAFDLGDANAAAPPAAASASAPASYMAGSKSLAERNMRDHTSAVDTLFSAAEEEDDALMFV